MRCELPVDDWTLLAMEILLLHLVCFNSLVTICSFEQTICKLSVLTAERLGACSQSIPRLKFRFPAHLHALGISRRLHERLWNLKNPTMKCTSKTRPNLLRVLRVVTYLRPSPRVKTMRVVMLKSDRFVVFGRKAK